MPFVCRRLREHGAPAGRADYFGTVSNLAARVAGLAAPGQILVEGREAFRREKDWRRKSDTITLLPDPLGGPKGMPGGNAEIVLEQIGYYLLKASAAALLSGSRRDVVLMHGTSENNSNSIQIITALIWLLGWALPSA